MMSRDLLERILINKIDSKVNLNDMVDFLLTFKQGQFIYPSTIKRKFKMKDKEIYDILNLLEKEHYLKMYYEVFCGFCSKKLKLYEYYSQLEKITYCDDCEENNVTLSNVKIIYKVVV